MKEITNREIKQLILLSNKWKKHKCTRYKHNDEKIQHYLKPIEREHILDEVFGIMFKT
jgi:hypothetical protein